MGRTGHKFPSSYRLSRKVIAKKASLARWRSSVNPEHSNNKEVVRENNLEIYLDPCNSPNVEQVVSMEPITNISIQTSSPELISEPSEKANITDAGTDALYLDPCNSARVNSSLELISEPIGTGNENITNAESNASCSITLTDVTIIADSNEDKSINDTSIEVSGRRLIDIGYFFTQILNSDRHAPFDCTIVDMDLIKEARRGLLSTFYLKCRMCNREQSIFSEDCSKNTRNINSESTLSAISVGLGFSQMEELFSTMNLPYMSNKTYQKTHEEISSALHSAAWQSMCEAAEEEKILAREIGDVNQDGIPEITVICDGAWSKRSYKSNYNAASGVGCIVGARTGKLLFLGVRNKYCSVCAKTSGSNVIKHVCFLNWDGPSTAMETDIIAEGFKQSIEMHGLIYKQLIGDGDSSVYRNLLKIKPYGHKMITKIECRNHLLRNFSNKLKEVSNRCKSNSANKPVPPILRNCLKKNLLRIRSSIRKATLHRIQEDEAHDVKIAKLSIDILNSISHVFGEHEKCKEIGYFCSGEPKEGEKDLVPAMKDCGIYQDIRQCLYRLVQNCSSLLTDMDNNAAESYNAVLCKFVGGKRLNFSQKGSYQARAEAAALSFNSKGNFHSTMDCQYSNKQYLKKYIAKCVKRRNTIKKISFRNKQRKITKKRNNFAPPDSNYGNVDQDVSPIERDNFLSELRVNKEEISDIEKNTRAQYNTALWFEERGKRLTASRFGEIIKMRQSTSPSKKIIEILYKKFGGNDNTRYGQENEPLAIECFEKELNVSVKKCGFFINEKYFYLGASPDGLIDEEHLVEIKCPSTCSKLHPSDAIKEGIIKFATMHNGSLRLKQNHNYYFQVQGQLQICNRQFCYFVVWSPLGILWEKIAKDEKCWLGMEPKLTTFYFAHLLPEILKPRLN